MKEVDRPRYARDDSIKPISSHQKFDTSFYDEDRSSNQYVNHSPSQPTFSDVHLEPLPESEDFHSLTMSMYQSINRTINQSVEASSRPHLSVLTGLRGILAVWILAHNLQYSGNIVDTVSWAVLSGSVAVSWFFVLSGFVLTYNYGDHSFASAVCYKHFLFKRIARLAPLYYVSQLLCCYNEVAFMVSDGIDVWTVLHLLALLTCTNSWFPWPIYSLGSSMVRGSVGYSFFNPTLWSISAEFGFYVVFPGLLRVMRKQVDVSVMSDIGRVDDGKLGFRLKRLIVLFGVVSLFSVLPTTFYLALIDSPYASIIYHMPWLRLSEFVLGMLSCGLFLAIKQMKLHELERPSHQLMITGHNGIINFISFVQSAYLLEVVVLLIVLLAVIVGLPALGLPSSLLAHNPGSASSLFALTILIMALCETNSTVSLVCYLLTSRGFVQLGVLSFAFYALHALIQIGPQIIGANQVNSFLVALFACTGLSLVGHYGLEKPVYQLLAKKVTKCECACEH